MFSSVIVNVAFGLSLLFAGGSSSPAVVGQAAGQATVKSATDRAEARVEVSAKTLTRKLVEHKKLKRKYDDQTRAIGKLKKGRASWNRDRKIRKAKAAAQSTGKKLSAVNKEIRRLRSLLLKQRRALIKATDAELASSPSEGRRAQLINLRTRTAAKLPTKRKARKIIIPEVDEYADPEELEEQAKLLAAAEKELVREQELLGQREKRFAQMARLRDQRQRAAQLGQFESNDVRRTTGRLNDPNKASADRGNNEAGGASAPQNDSDLSEPPPSPEDPGTGGGEDFGDGGGLEQSSVVLADVVDSSTVSELRRAGRSSNPKTKAQAARKARKQVSARLAKIRALRKKMAERAKQLRK